MSYNLRILVLFTTFLLASSAGAQFAPAPRPAHAAFSKLKGLVGYWEARAPQVYGDAVIRLDYRLISDDSVLIETFAVPEQDLEMVTMYHLDGGELLLTHYCVVNNQVRMRADLAQMPTVPANVRSITFEFRDASNLEQSDMQVMDRLGIVFEDDNHITQSWRWRDGKVAKGEDTAVYRFTRIR